MCWTAWPLWECSSAMRLKGKAGGRPPKWGGESGGGISQAGETGESAHPIVFAVEQVFDGTCAIVT